MIKMEEVSLFTKEERAEFSKQELPLIVQKDFGKLVVFWADKRKLFIERCGNVKQSFTS